MPVSVAAKSFPDVVAELEGSTMTPVLSPSSGFMVRQVRPEGSFVRKGDLLFELDPQLVHSPAEMTPGHVVPSGISSPADGIVQRAAIGPGDLVTPLVALTQVATIDPIKARFDGPAGYNVKAGRTDQVEFISADGSQTGAKASIVVERATDTASSKLTPAYALFPNPAHELLPGQYVKLRDLPAAGPRSFRVPSSCVTTSNGSDRLFVIGSGDKIERRHVTVGSRTSEACLISDGVQPSDHVVLDGTMPFTGGEVVTPQMAVSR